MATEANSSKIFTDFQEYLDKEQDIREEIRLVVREIEQKAREILAVLQAIHQQDAVKRLGEICKQARGLYADVRTSYQTLANKIPKDEFYRFNDHWRFVTQRLCFMAALILYLESDKLISHEDCAQQLGVKVKREDGFHIDLDDFLIGLLQMASELARLSVNAVTAGDYARPMKVSKFLGELDSGFRLLNLKNDALRKRYDALKYDLKKVEEVVYDVTIRGLKPAEEA